MRVVGVCACRSAQPANSKLKKFTVRNKTKLKIQFNEMVQVIVHCNQLGEWCLIELQGRLERSDGITENTGSGTIGNIYFDNKETPYIIIGSHILDGKIVPIDKPLIVLEKEKADHQTAESDENYDQSNSTEYKMKAMIKTKLIFKNRPKPIVLQQHVKKKPRIK